MMVRRLMFAGLLTSLGGVALAEPSKQALKPAQIDRNGVLILLRSSLTALDQANKTGNYTVLRDLSSPGFAAANSAAKLGEIFASERSSHLDLSGTLVLDPQLTVLPETDEMGHMRFAGFFPSAPTQVEFHLAFEPVNGQWRLFELGVNLVPSGPSAPVPPAPPPTAANVAPPVKAPITAVRQLHPAAPPATPPADAGKAK